MFGLTKPANRLQSQDSDKDYFITAVAYFSLIHTQLISFQATLKVQEIAQKSNELASTSEELTAMTEEVTASVQQINHTTQQVAASSEEGVKNIETMTGLGSAAQNVMAQMIDNATQLINQISNIEEISGDVEDIADQTNLLALNAAIEAARAGEAGKGFEVVAAEVRKLAEQTKDAVSRVKKISMDMNKKASLTNSNINSVNQTFNQYLTGFSALGEMIMKNNNEIEQSAQMVENINVAMEQQSSATQSLTQISGNLAQNTNLIANLLSHEADYLFNIVEPLLEFNEDNSSVNILAARLRDHANFLKKTMAQAGSGQKVNTHNECSFGKWYNENKATYGKLPAFLEVDHPHQMVHTAAQKLSNEYNSQNIEQLMQASGDILKAFIKLYHEFNKLDS